MNSLMRAIWADLRLRAARRYFDAAETYVARMDAYLRGDGPRPDRPRRPVWGIL